MEIGIVRQIDIDQQMQEAYLDYAMSVIVSRALPDVRDGLKPVHRRILYAMHDMGLRPNQPHKKSARIVGEVLGKYHPHGDAAVYDSMVRMAQEFSMRAPLVDGQGNFGSIDGDSAAAMRYTEARMAAVAEELLTDIDKNTVNFVDNFDGSLTEPTVLPSKLPNLLINGASGIAVGMSTSIPPHNLTEVCEALLFMIEQTLKNKDVSIDDLLEYIQGPDFPTGGIVYRYRKSRKGDEENDHIRAAYAVGRGRVTVQARVHVEEMSRNRHRLVITELPYQTNKTKLIEKIASLAREGKLEGLADLRDESDRQGMRIVLELSRTVAPQTILKRLFKMTPMRSTFSIIMLALVDGEPRLLPLKRCLQLFIAHRRSIITRRSQHQLKKAKERAHILEGLRTALASLDEVIDTIRASRTVNSARNNLRRNFKLSEPQANAILETPLRRLAALERKKIEKEYKALLKEIKNLEGLLKSNRKILNVIKKELTELKETYGTPRRTLIVDKTAGKDKVRTARELVPAEDVVAAVTESGKLCRWPASERLEPARGRQTDPLATAVVANTRDTLFLFTQTGQAIVIPMHQVPKGSALGDGPHLSEFSSNGVSQVVAGLALPNDKKTPGHLFLMSKGGRVKRIILEELQEARGRQTPVMGVERDDALIAAFPTTGQDDILLVSAQGQGIRFKEDEVRAMGLTATGVWGMKLVEGDYLVGGGATRPWAELVVITEQGIGKRSDVDDFPTQGRYGQGVIAQPIDQKTGPVAAASVINLSDRVMMLALKKNNKTVYGRSLPKLNRTHEGESLISTRGKNEVVRLVTLPTD